MTEMQLTAYKSRPGCEHVWEDAHLTLRAGDGNPVLQTKVRHCRKCGDFVPREDA